MTKDAIETGCSESMTGNPNIKGKCIAGLRRKYVLLLLVIYATTVLLFISVIVLIVAMRGTLEIQPQKCDPCEDGWIWNRGKCYYFSVRRDTWSKSRGFCELRNSSLVLIDNEAELEFLFRFKCGDSYWIGMKWNTANRTWVWINGTVYNSTFFQIQRAFPDGEEYVFLNDGIVKSEDLNYKNKWICTTPIK